MLWDTGTLLIWVEWSQSMGHTLYAQEWVAYTTWSQGGDASPNEERQKERWLVWLLVEHSWVRDIHWLCLVHVLSGCLRTSWMRCHFGSRAFWALLWVFLPPYPPWWFEGIQAPFSSEWSDHSRWGTLCTLKSELPIRHDRKGATHHPTKKDKKSADSFGF